MLCSCLLTKNLLSRFSGRRRTSTASSKHSCLSLSPSPNSKSSSHSGETSLLPVLDKALSKSQQSDLNAYLSKRRNTTGSISINKLVDLKNVSNVHSLKITSAHNSSNKIAAESKYFHSFEEEINHQIIPLKISFKRLKIPIFSELNI